MKTRIAIDVDEVLRDFVGQIQNLIQQETGIQTERPKQYYYDTLDETGVSFRKKIWGTGEWAEPVFVGAPVKPKAKTGYHMFCDDPQFEVYIVSSQKKGTELHTDKWLLKNGFDRHVRNIYTSKKLEAPCQILIDDKIENVQDYLDEARMGVVMDAPHNQHEQLPYRVFDLIEAYNLLK
jgi:5'(3')-deoxyribonucleotidase